MMEEPRYTECNHCTYKLVAIAYERTSWFRLFREPLIMGIRYFVWIHRVDVNKYLMRTPACNNCIRFYKTALFGRSSSFRWLHNRINPIFNNLIRRIVTDDERKRAKEFAIAATEGTLSEAEVTEWMHGLKNSL